MVSDAGKLSDSRTSANDESLRSRRRQLARILCHLRDQLSASRPDLNMPTRHMIEELVFNGLVRDGLHGEDWEGMLYATLLSIRDLADAQIRSHEHFQRRDGSGRLFPHEELFDEWDCFHFCEAVLRQLDAQLRD